MSDIRLKIDRQQSEIIRRQKQLARHYVFQRVGKWGFEKILKAAKLRYQTALVLGGEKFEAELKQVYDAELTAQKKSVEDAAESA